MTGPEHEILREVSPLCLYDREMNSVSFTFSKLHYEEFVDVNSVWGAVNWMRPLALDRFLRTISGRRSF